MVKLYKISNDKAEAFITDSFSQCRKYFLAVEKNDYEEYSYYSYYVTYSESYSDGGLKPELK